MKREAAVPLSKRRPSDDPFSQLVRSVKIRAAVRDVLSRYSRATLKELIERVEEEHGITMGTSNMACIRQELRGA
jgi:hypothetical protein